MNEVGGGWRKEILAYFPPDAYRLTLAADPDGLLTEEEVSAALRERGYDLLEFEDPIAFRYAYETRHRSRWEWGENTHLVVVLEDEPRKLEDLPYDLLREGRRLSFSLTDFFPNLSYPVISALNGAELEELYRAQTTYAPNRLGETATRDFVLRHVHGIAPETIKQPEDLLRVLLRRHYRESYIPNKLDERLIRLLRESGRFDGWPLESIVPDRDAFLSFLQERWPVFLDHRTGGAEAAREPGAAYALEHPGPAELPFDDSDVRVYMDNLFLEGLLRPVSHPRAELLSKEWFAAGLKTDPQQDQRRRLEGLLVATEESAPGNEAGYRDWLDFAPRWAELTALRHESGAPDLEQRFGRLRERVDKDFLDWLLKRYGGLHNLSAVSPVMVHHVSRKMARALDNGERKVAVLVLDGLAFDQWVTLRDSLPGTRFQEEATFAWLPTITPVSRQAIFAGKPPALFSANMENNRKERELWKRFWADQSGLRNKEVVYENIVGNEDIETIEESISDPRVRVAGIVVRMVDEIMHGMKLGARGMHDQVRGWAEQGHLIRLFDMLSERGFGVYLTSDHGNIEAVGHGRPSEGSIAEVRGERARVYSDPLLRELVAKRFPEAIEWPATSLPEGYLPLLAHGCSAFVSEKERIVGHGGASLEEVVVPFVKLEQERD